ncbi:hypothetical protein TFLX_02558 [Thermoflexales bacterium]|nr:hypothetical protein TFLX_02558 [Thermoflexales bacterium]
MPSLLEQIRTRIQDPKRTTTMNQYSPRRRGLFSPATLSVVEATEKELGFKLPTLLSQLYTQVANGGFGPGYGIYGLEGGYADPIPMPPDEIDRTKGGILTDWYFCYRGTDEQIPELDFNFFSQGKSTLFIDPEVKPGNWGWFDKLLLISDHGCWQFSCIDCSKPDYPMYYFDGQQCELRPENLTFDEWINNWLCSDSYKQ